MGKRNKTNLQKVISTLILADARQIVTDKLNIYKNLIPKELHSTRHRGINHIERQNLTLRTHLKRLGNVPIRHLSFFSEIKSLIFNMILIEIITFRIMTELYDAYIGLERDSDLNVFFDFFGFSFVNRPFQYELCGSPWSLEIDTDQDNIFTKEEMEEKYDFDSFFLKHIFVNEKIERVLQISFSPLEIDQYSLIANKKIFEYAIVELTKKFHYPFVVRSRWREEFIYPQYLKIEN